MKNKKKEEGLEEDLEGDFTNYKTPHIIPAGYNGNLDESISFLSHVIAERCCLPGYPRAKGVTAVSCVNTPLRREEVTKAHIESMKYLNKEELERKLKENEVELPRLLDAEKHLRNEQRELLGELEGEASHR